MQSQKLRKTPAEILDSLTLFDDDLMSMVFDDNTEATELLLRIVLERDDLRVISVEGQKELENPLVDGRNIRLDIFAEDNDGKYYDIEVQRNNAGAGFRRARFHSSMLDARMLKQREVFQELADSFVVFFTENDIIGLGCPLYHIDRTIRESHADFADGSHIIYVNGQYQGSDPIGKLMHDFRCKEPDEMYYSELAKGVRHFKQTEGGRGAMCEAVKEYGEQVAEERRIETLITVVRNLVANASVTLEQAMNLAGVSGADRAVIQEAFLK